jgi:serine/threonine protein kinase
VAGRTPDVREPMDAEATSGYESRRDGDPRVGTIVAGHRIDGVVGRGGMGVVYRATELALERAVALKVISPDLADDPHARRRFITESKLAASIDHPNVIPVYHVGEHDGMLFLTMRFVVGDDLHAVLRREGVLELARAVDIVDQIAKGLDAAHTRGLVHRDVKPGNVLLAENDHVYLTDFGLTKRLAYDEEQTQTNGFVGTLDYISPEHLRGEPVDGRADVYALGCLAFKLLTGFVPFRVDYDYPREWAEQPTAAPPLADFRPDLAREVGRVLDRALRKDPSERYARASELSRDLQAAVATANAPEVAKPSSADAAQSDERSGSGRTKLHQHFRRDERRAAPEVDELLGSIELARREIRDAAKRSPLAYAGLGDELRELSLAIKQGRKGSVHDYNELVNPPRDIVQSRLQEELARADPKSRKLVAALKDQLLAKRRAEERLSDFTTELERVLVELDSLHHVVCGSTSAAPATERIVIERLRSLGGQMRAVNDEIAVLRTVQNEPPSVLARLSLDA